MMIEVMAGKSAAIHGLVHDATPFRFSENETAVEYFGKLLEQGGYNYYGTERMYSGIDGREMTANIFFGIVHYQRLRHMVSDKWQVCYIKILIAFAFDINIQTNMFYIV
jgi:DNA-directed RNA polymerase I subunit RPA2